MLSRRLRMIDESWASLLETLDTVVPRFRPSLRPGATEETLATLERTVGAPLPAALRRLLAKHDGQPTVCGELLSTHRLCTCAEIAKWYRFWYVPLEGASAPAHVGYGTAKDGRFVQLTDSDGDAFLVELRTGEIFFHVRAEGVFGPVASDVGALFDDIRARIVDGRAAIDERGTEDAFVDIDDFNPAFVPERFPRL